MLQNSINEVYVLLIEAQNEAQHYKKQTEFDLGVIKEIKANAAKAKLEFEEELSKRAAELYKEIHRQLVDKKIQKEFFEVEVELKD